MIHIPKHFIPKELLDRATFARFGADGLRYFRPGILKAFDWIWENYPTTGRRLITVNTWHIDGDKQWRGLRNPACPEYKPGSAHSVGAGIDGVPQGITAQAARDWIQDQHALAVASGDSAEKRPILYVRRMEIGTPTWIHLDSLEWNGLGLQLVNP